MGHQEAALGRGLLVHTPLRSQAGMGRLRYVCPSRRPRLWSQQYTLEP